MASSSKEQQPSEDSWNLQDGTVDDLREAVVANLEHRGVMGKLRAKVRAEVFHTLEGPREGTRPAALSNESFLINELVREYLTYSGYQNALGVFMAESGQPQDKALDRAFIRDELGLTERRGTDGSKRPPLLYGITHALKCWKEGSSKQGVAGSGEYIGGRTGGGPRRVPVSAEEDFLLPGDAGPATAAESGVGTDESHPGMGKRDPPPLVFTKRSSGSP